MKTLQLPIAQHMVGFNNSCACFVKVTTFLYAQQVREFHILPSACSETKSLYYFSMLLFLTIKLLAVLSHTKQLSSETFDKITFGSLVNVHLVFIHKTVLLQYYEGKICFSIYAICVL